MNRLEIIRMAQESGFMAAGHPMNPWSAHTDQIEAFAALIAKHEREQILDLECPLGWVKVDDIRARKEK